MAAYYNEFDPFKAQVLREAIKAGAIAPGEVDERSIVEVEPSDLVGFTQCHFFGGGGFWSLALRQAGWPDARECWTGSCPCPSFSAAGKGKGFADPRHLWPEWFRLICECRPTTILGEQVASAIGHGWFDLVGMDLESKGYAVASEVLPAASVGAPHIRNRLFFVAELSKESEPQTIAFGVSKLANSECSTQRGRRLFGPGESSIAERTGPSGQSLRSSAYCILGDSENGRRGICGDAAQPGGGGYADGAKQFGNVGDASRTGLQNIELETLEGTRRREQGRAASEPGKASCGLADAAGARQQDKGQYGSGLSLFSTRSEQHGGVCELGFTDSDGCGQGRGAISGTRYENSTDTPGSQCGGMADLCSVGWNGGKGPKLGMSPTGKMPDGSKATVDLSAAVKMMAAWPTPAVDSFRSRSGDKINEMGLDQMARTIPERPDGPMRITASGRMLTGSDAVMGSSGQCRGQLNPGLSRWLMSIPPIWDIFCFRAAENMASRRSSKKAKRG